MSVSTTTCTGNGDVAPPSRQELIYSTHQQLEDALDTLRAYVSAAQKHQGKTTIEDGGFSPWTGVQESVEKCAERAIRCLRLFTPARRITQLKGMTTLTQLYGAATAAPPARVRAFLDAVGNDFGGVLPVETALSGGRCLHRLDPAAADDFLVAYVQAVLAPPPPTEGADAIFRQQYRACLGLDPREVLSFVRSLRALLLLQIEAAAQADHTNHTLQQLETTSAVVAEAVTGPVYAELQRYEAVCWREAARMREAVNDARPSPTTSGAPPTSSTAVVTPSAPQPQQPGARESQRGGGSAAASPLAGASTWKWHAVRLAVLVLLAVLVRFTSGPLARALKAAMQVTHPVQTRRRTLTL